MKEKWRVNGRVGAIVRECHILAEKCGNIVDTGAPSVTEDYEAHTTLMIIKHLLDGIVDNFEGIVKKDSNQEA